ncbi:hypothetical protein [Streptomyces sp. ISL-100]|uniref:hypothetical protein n=1 Tax=Streptomyces sp. ISL-100 TaxID=2819173 RepID=UPI001BEA7FBE|nr:hypothetical protein [Streptomyces sp. ISL-100]
MALADFPAEALWRLVLEHETKVHVTRVKPVDVGQVLVLARRKATLFLGVDAPHAEPRARRPATLNSPQDYAVHLAQSTDSDLVQLLENQQEKWKIKAVRLYAREAWHAYARLLTWAERETGVSEATEERLDQSFQEENGGRLFCIDRGDRKKTTARAVAASEVGLA